MLVDKPTAAPGSYILILQSEINRTIQVGRLGQFALAAGLLFVRGQRIASGVAARVAHQRVSARPQPASTICAGTPRCASVFCRHDPVRREHTWAQRLAQSDSLSIPLPGFGASDRACRSHLFYSSSLPQIDQLLNLL
ncbi:MAG: DUF123 domain-containing protein [Caldilineaceae bacterium]